MQVDRVLVKFLIRLDHLRRCMATKVPKIEQKFPQISEKDFWKSSTDLKLTIYALHHAHLRNTSVQKHHMSLSLDVKCAKG